MANVNKFQIGDVVHIAARVTQVDTDDNSLRVQFTDAELDDTWLWFTSQSPAPVTKVERHTRLSDITEEVLNDD